MKNWERHEKRGRKTLDRLNNIIQCTADIGTIRDALKTKLRREEIHALLRQLDRELRTIKRNFFGSKGHTIAHALGTAFKELRKAAVEIQLLQHEIKRLKMKSEQVGIDENTKLPTGRLFVRLLILFLNRLRRRSSEMTHHALFVMDMRKFKRINNLCGHKGGDIAIREIAELIQDIRVSGDDLYARSYGRGDEFLVFISGLRRIEDVVHVVSRFLAAVRAHDWVKKLRTKEGSPYPGKVEIDIGVMQWEESSLPQKTKYTKKIVEAIITRTDEMMLAAKRTSTRAVVVYGEGVLEGKEFRVVKCHSAEEFQEARRS